MRWKAEAAGYLRVQQEKTGKRLAIEVTAPLRAVLARCRDRLVSPYIIHRAPEKRRSREDRAEARENPTQVMPEQLTRAFQDAREKCGFYAESGHPPGFHEIRSLGAALYRQNGWPEPRVQALLGHADISMTRHYLEGHEAPWDPVSCGLETG